jgi:hypothetical protein
MRERAISIPRNYTLRAERESRALLFVCVSEGGRGGAHALHNSCGTLIARAELEFRSCKRENDRSTEPKQTLPVLHAANSTYIVPISELCDTQCVIEL